MKIKERKEGNLSIYLIKNLKLILRKIFNKKVRIIIKILLIIIILLIGFLSGLAFKGYFGTLDNPSQIALDLAHSMGIMDLRTLKLEIESITAENIRIPFNWIKGQFSNPEKIYIDIKFADFQKLEYKRQQALDAQVLITSAGDYVPAIIKYKDKEINVRLRLKGDTASHLEGDKWSFRIKVRGDETLFGMKTFSIQDPRERLYLHEPIYHKALEREGVISLRYNFIEVVINGENKGVFAIEEHFEKQLIENNQRREGVLLKFYENTFVDELRRVNPTFSDINEQTEYSFRKSFDLFHTSNIQTFDDEDVLADPVLSKQFLEAKGLLESFRKGSLQTHEVFDIDLLAKYFAINTVLSSEHASSWGNIRFYYNPIISKIEPVGYDAGGKAFSAYTILDDYYIPECFSQGCEEKHPFYHLVFKDKIFFEKYVQELERVSEKSYLDSLFLELDDELKTGLNIIHKDKPSYHFSTDLYYLNQQQIQNKLNPIKGLNAYLEETNLSEDKIVISVGNNDNFPLEVVSLIYNDSVAFKLNQENKIVNSKPYAKSAEYQQFEFKIPLEYSLKEDLASKLKINYKVFGAKNMYTILVQPYAYVGGDFVEKDFIRQESNISSFEFLEIDESTKSIKIKQGDWVLNQDLIIPKGFNVFCEGETNIDFLNGSAILSYSNLQFSGTKEKLIKIFSSDKTGQGLAVLNADKNSNLNYVVFENIKNPVKQGWELTGAITFYKSPVKLNNVVIKNIDAEDGLNIFDSNFEIKDSVFENSFSDCFDNDFGEGLVESSSFVNCGNDGLDFSGSVVDVNNVEILNAGDKGLSAGEESEINIKNLKVIGNVLNKIYIGIASKDKSQILIQDSKISNVEYGFAVYEKKSEYGSATINSINTEINADKDHIVEKDSELLIDDTIILSKEEGVYLKLYPEG